METFLNFLKGNFFDFLTYTGFANAEIGNLIMIAVGAFFIWLAIKKDFEPLLLVPIGLGIILGNIPFKTDAGLEIGLYEDNSVLNIFYQGVKQGWYPPSVLNRTRRQASPASVVPTARQPYSSVQSYARTLWVR